MIQFSSYSARFRFSSIVFYAKGLGSERVGKEEGELKGFLVAFLDTTEMDEDLFLR